MPGRILYKKGLHENKQFKAFDLSGTNPMFHDFYHTLQFDNISDLADSEGDC